MAKGENSFDVACKVDPQAVADAVHQSTREVQTRYDLKQTKTELGLEKDAITVHTDNDYTLKQVLDVLQSKLHRRGVPLKALTYGKVEPAAGGTVRQRIDVQQGIPMEKAKETYDRLLRLGLVVRPFGDAIRITVHAPRANDRLLNALEQANG